MSLRTARPWKDPRTGVYHLRQRTPCDLVERFRGRSVSIPIDGAWAFVTVGPIVQASLRTKEPGEARFRHSIADAALKQFWQAQRDGGSSDIRDGQPEPNEPEYPQAIELATVSVPPVQPTPSPAPASAPPLTATDLFERWATYSADKRAANTIKRYRGSFRSFIAFTENHDVRSLSGDDVFAWAEHRRDVEGVSAKSINQNDIVTVSSVFRWAMGRTGGRVVPSNPATGISLDEPRIAQQRERTFREDEIAAILGAASAVKHDDENPTRSAMRRWCPWLTAYSGARIAELTNLEKQDIRVEAGIPLMHLRVTKTGEARAVPLHPHLIDQGFLAFAEAAAPGPLFYDPQRYTKASTTTPAEQQSKKLGKWVRETVNLDPAVDPNHGWRHTWKTRALGAGIEERLRDAITGHRVASVGRRYETPTLTMLAKAMEQFPRYCTKTIVLDLYTSLT